MAHAFQPRIPIQRSPSSWPRRHRRRWLRANDFSAVDALMSAIPSLPRPVLARLAEQMINRMDDLDGDPDVELNGDELDATNTEDDFYEHSNWLGHPGCPVSDPGEEDDPGGGAVDDEGEPDAWRDTLVTVELPRYGVDQTRGPTNVAGARERLLRAYARYDHVTPQIATAIIAVHEEQAYE